MTTPPELNIGITAQDMNQVIAENPVVGLQLRIAAMGRALEEQQVRINELEAELASRDSDATVPDKAKKKD